MTVDLVFEMEFEKFVRSQQAGAVGLRLEMLQKNLEGTKTMFKKVFWPMLKSFDGFILEYEFVNRSGVRMYVDAFYEPLNIAFECEGFVVHAGNITRDQFNRERARIRTLANNGYIYFPFSWDELDKNAEMCRTSVYELMGKYGVAASQYELTIHEREFLRHALMLNKPFRVLDVREHLKVGEKYGRKIVRSLMENKLIKPYSKGEIRHHLYIVDRDEIRRRRIL